MNTHAHAQIEPYTTFAFETEFGRECLHAKGGRARPYGIVLMSDGSAEQSQDCVPYVTFNVSPLLLNNPAKPCKTIIHDRVNLFGVELFAYRRETADIRKKDGNVSSLSIR
jgi:hypothetical protein